MKNKKYQHRKSRETRVRKKILKNKLSTRLSVYRSNRYIYAQLINDHIGKTLISACDKDLNIDTNKNINQIEKAQQIGVLLAQKAKKIKITNVVFDRGGYKYHGRVKALAQGARSGGLIF